MPNDVFRSSPAYAWLACPGEQLGTQIGQVVQSLVFGMPKHGTELEGGPPMSASIMGNAGNDIVSHFYAFSMIV